MKTKVYNTTDELRKKLEAIIEVFTSITGVKGLTLDFLYRSLMIDLSNELSVYMMMNDMFSTFYLESKLDEIDVENWLDESYEEGLIESYFTFKDKVFEPYCAKMSYEEIINNFYIPKDKRYKNINDFELKSENGKLKNLSFSKELVQVLNYANVISEKKNGEGSSIDEEALIVALVQNSSNLLVYILKNVPFSASMLNNFNEENYYNDNLKNWREDFGEEFIEEMVDSVNDYYNNDSFETMFQPAEASKLKDIPRYLKSLNAKVKKGESYTICGRDEEIKRAFHALQKMGCKNIIFTGKAGVGKTAIVEGMAERIVNSDCPKALMDKEIMSLDRNTFLAGAKYVGDTEERYEELNNFLLNNPNVILFIDEIHNIIGAGRAEASSYDLSNALKPLLTGDISVIGATTEEEYERYISRETALSRRFERISIEEPNSKELEKMLKGKCKQLEKYHKVKITKEAFDYAVSQEAIFYPSIARPASIVELLDSALVIAKQEGKNVLDKESIDKINERFLKKLDRAKKINPKSVLGTAYHEMGHFLVSKKLLSNYNRVTLVSIIPTEDYLGVNFFEKEEKFFSNTLDYCVNRLSMFLAGITAEKMKGYKDNLGKYSDYQKAYKYAKNIILQYGLIDTSKTSLGKYIFINSNSKLEELSDQQKEALAKEVERLLAKAEKRAKRVLEENNEKLEYMAKVLYEKGALTEAELNELYSQDFEDVTQKVKCDNVKLLTTSRK